MPKKKTTAAQGQAWADAQRRHRLSAAQVQMARELGLNPKKLGKIDNHRQEPWKVPLPQFIEDLYARRFGRPTPRTAAPNQDSPAAGADGG
jgi:hypothetical protein